MTGLAALGVLSLASLPPEHLHVTRTHDGHHSDVIHRHYASHQPAAGKTAGVSDDDGQPRWLDSPFIGASPAAQIDPIDQLLHQDRPAVPARLTGVGSVAPTHPSIHGPPLEAPSGLRAPPAFSSDVI